MRENTLLGNLGEEHTQIQPLSADIGLYVQFPTREMSWASCVILISIWQTFFLASHGLVYLLFDLNNSPLGHTDRLLGLLKVATKQLGY